MGRHAVAWWQAPGRLIATTLRRVGRNGLVDPRLRGDDDDGRADPIRLLSPYSTTTGILPIFACHSRGPVLCTDSPLESTATVTGMSCTSNS